MPDDKQSGDLSPLRFAPLTIGGDWSQFDPLLLVHLADRYGDFLKGTRPQADPNGLLYGMTRDLVAERECGETVMSAILFRPSSIDHAVNPPAYWEDDPLIMVPLSHIVAVACGVEDSDDE